MRDSGKWSWKTRVGDEMRAQDNTELQSKHYKKYTANQHNSSAYILKKASHEQSEL